MAYTTTHSNKYHCYLVILPVLCLVGLYNCIRNENSDEFVNENLYQYPYYLQSQSLCNVSYELNSIVRYIPPQKDPLYAIQLTEQKLNPNVALYNVCIGCLSYHTLGNVLYDAITLLSKALIVSTHGHNDATAISQVGCSFFYKYGSLLWSFPTSFSQISQGLFEFIGHFYTQKPVETTKKWVML